MQPDTYAFIVIVHILVTVIVAVFPHVHIDVEAEADVKIISTLNDQQSVYRSGCIADVNHSPGPRFTVASPTIPRLRENDSRYSTTPT